MEAFQQGKELLANPSFDSFSLGVSIFHALTGEEPKYRGAVLGLLSEQELDEYCKRVTDSILFDTNLDEFEKKIKLQILMCARQLVQRNPENRPSCEDMARELTHISWELAMHES